MVVDAGSSQNVMCVYASKTLSSMPDSQDDHDETTYMHQAAHRLRRVRKHFLANVIKRSWITLNTLETASQNTNCFIRCAAVFRYSRSSIDDNCQRH
jgi:hypothetical protein